MFRGELETNVGVVRQICIFIVGKSSKSLLLYFGDVPGGISEAVAVPCRYAAACIIWDFLFPKLSII